METDHSWVSLEGVVTGPQAIAPGKASCTRPGTAPRGCPPDRRYSEENPHGLSIKL